MREFADNCIVLRVSDYRDDDRLAKVLTAENGIVTVLMRGVKKAKAKLKAFSQPFVSFNARLVSGKGAFLTVIDPMMISDAFTLSADMRIYTAASVAAEATLVALVDDQPHTDVFIEFLKLIKALEFNGDAYYQAAVYMCKLLQYTGFYREHDFFDDPKTPAQLIGYAQKCGYVKREDDDLSRRALKYICGEFARDTDCVLKSAGSIDLYA